MTTSATNVEVRYRATDSSGAWSTPQSFPVAATITIAGLQRGKSYDFQARSVSNCGARSAWVAVSKVIADAAAGGSRQGVSQVDANGNPAIDFSDTIHTNKSLDFIPNGSIWIAGTQYANGAQVDNANFEASATLPPPGWLSNGAGTLVYTPSGKQHAGNRSASFQSNGVGSRVQSTRTYKCTPGDVWYLQAWMSASSLGACVGQMSFYSAATGFISNVSAFSAPVGATTWQFYAGAVQVPAGADYFKISFGGDTPGSILYVDDIALGQVLQQARLDPLTWAGARSILSGSPISYSISGTTVNFTVAAFTVYGGSQNISYNAASGSVTQAAGTTMTYYLVYDDPTSTGGSKTLGITATVQRLAQVVGRVNIGSATVTVAAGGGGSSGTGGGGGGFCVCMDMWIDHSTQAKDAMLGHPFDCCDFKTSGTATFKRPMLAVEYEVTECVRLTTERGAVLDCGVTTPFDTIDGHTMRAPQMMDELVLTDDGLEQVVSVEPIGIKPVCFFHFGGISYAAGSDPSHRIYSHNPGTQKP